MADAGETAGKVGLTDAGETAGEGGRKRRNRCNRITKVAASGGERHVFFSFLFQSPLFSVF